MEYVKKREKMHTQRHACKGMSKKIEENDDSPQLEISKEKESCKRVNP
jgi:hypothetical protein